MWLVFTLFFALLLAIVNWIDEYLTANNGIPESADVHTKVGGLVLVSTLLTIAGAVVIYFFADSVALNDATLALAFFSAVPMVAMWAGYFYLLKLFPVYQVIPLFQMSSIWLLIMELISGGSITLVAFLGVFIIVVGVYLVDAGTLRWQIPTKLLLSMVPVSFGWALAVFMVKEAIGMGADVLAVTFWQYVGITFVGILLLVVVKKYRDGLVFRIRGQGRVFLGYSVVSEGLSQTAYWAGNVAVALAPLAVYFNALGGVQSVILLFIFLLFPQRPTSANWVQIAGIFMIAGGVFLLEGWKYV